mmetsp:Transcript_54916/g.112113  ORF Transcript_54916/g.112113 Transcript_54916/m.112113 type:complete len:221 (+) Transcript_54916:986-1648(+)
MKSFFSVTRCCCPDRLLRTSAAVSESISTACCTLPMTPSYSVGNTSFSPCSTRIFPVCLSSSLTYSKHLRSIACSIPGSSTRSNTPGTTRPNGPRTTRSSPVRSSTNRTYSLAFREIAVALLSISSYGFRKSNFGPSSMRKSPLKLFFTLTYSKGPSVNASCLSTLFKQGGTHVIVGPLMTLERPVIVFTRSCSFSGTVKQPSRARKRETIAALEGGEDG